MRAALRRAAIGMAAVATVIGLTAGSAAADNTYHPSDADFADCPARPANATGIWTCYVMTALGGYLRLDKMSANISAPWRLTVAQGTVGGVPVGELGGLVADPVPFVTGIPGTPFVVPDPTGWSVQPVAVGPVKPGLLMPDSVGLKVKIIGSGLGDSCLVGSNASPVVINPHVSWFLPWVFDGTPMINTQVYDDVYSLPGAAGCSSDFTVDQLLGVPANATSNYLQIHWAFRQKTL